MVHELLNELLSKKGFKLDSYFVLSDDSKSYAPYLYKEQSKQIFTYFAEGFEVFAEIIIEDNSIKVDFPNFSETITDIIKLVTISEEEPKQEYQSECICENSCIGFVNVKCKQLNKQETVEEVAERLFPFTKDDSENRIITIKRLYWIEGAKWKAERMYSEEEVLELLFKCHFVEQNIEEWFEQHKKK
jgi:hypothetical protein